MKTLIALVIAVLLVACDPPVGPDKPNGGSGVVQDGSGNWYTTVKLGLLEWTVENLRATHYADGTPIPIEDDGFEWYWRGDSALCAFNDRLGAVENYGYHYNWHVIDPKNPHKIAPEGWRVPTNEDWDYLVNESSYMLYGYKRIIRAWELAAATTDWKLHTQPARSPHRAEPLWKTTRPDFQRIRQGIGAWDSRQVFLEGSGLMPLGGQHRRQKILCIVLTCCIQT